MNKIKPWVIDYIYLLRGQARAFRYRKPPDHYLGHIVKKKATVLFIPGLLEKWSIFAHLANKISLLGHPVYVIPKLGLNIMDIPKSAEIIKEVIDQNNLKNIIVVAHSKGGLIGKYLLAHLNDEERITRLITIATPFSGVTPAGYIPIKHYQELSTTSKIIADLLSHSHVNPLITSIYPIFDNHIWPKSSSHLEGAENIEINVAGHHKILFAKEVEDKILELVN